MGCCGWWLAPPCPACARRNAFQPQKLRTGCATILTLDGSRITSNGIVSGASFAVQPLDRAEQRFGSSGLLGEVRAVGGLLAPPCAAARVAPAVLLAAALCSFGCPRLLPLPTLQNPAAAQAAEQAAALEEWVELLRSRDQLEAAAQAAQASWGTLGERESRGHMGVCGGAG